MSKPASPFLIQVQRGEEAKRGKGGRKTIETNKGKRGGENGERGKRHLSLSSPPPPSLLSPFPSSMDMSMRLGNLCLNPLHSNRSNRIPVLPVPFSHPTGPRQEKRLPATQVQRLIHQFPLSLSFSSSFVKNHMFISLLLIIVKSQRNGYYYWPNRQMHMHR